MGKINKRHRNKKKHFSNDNAAGERNQNGVSNQTTEEEDEFSKVMSDIVDKLESQSIMEKLSALLLLSEMVDMKQIRSIIIDHEICKIVGPLLVDTDIQVCLNAAGAIRNLTTCGEEEVLEALVEQDVLTPVLTLLSNLARTLQKPNSLDTSMEIDGAKTTQKKVSKTEYVQWEEKIDLACQVVNTLWNLCESCATVLKYVNNEEVMSVFVQFLNVDKYDISLSIAAAQFIHMLSEDNTFGIKYLIQHEAQFEAGFQAVGSTTCESNHLNGCAVLLQVLYAGILQNITPNFFTKDPNTFKILTQILSTNQRQALNQFTSDLPKVGDKTGKARIESVAHFISAQKLILEFITNLCSSDEDEDPEVGCSGMDVDLSEDPEESVTDVKVKLSPVLLERFIEADIFSVVLEKVDLPAANVCEILRGEEECRYLMDKIINLQCTGFLCINNLVQCMDIPEETMFSQFVTILCHHYTDDLRGEQRVAITCALRSLILSLQEAVTSSTSNVSKYVQDTALVRLIDSKQDILGDSPLLSNEPLFKISKLLLGTLLSEEVVGSDEKSVIEVKMNLVKITCVWTSLVFKVKRFESKEHDSLIATRLLQFLHSVENLILLAETLDCLIDVFSDDDTDQLAKQIQLISKLGASEPKLKNMIKSNKKTLDSEKLALVSTVQTNLHAFIQYKRQRIANI